MEVSEPLEILTREVLVEESGQKPGLSEFRIIWKDTNCIRGRVS